MAVKALVPMNLDPASTISRSLAFDATEPASFESWKAELRRGLRTISGLDILAKTPWPIEVEMGETIDVGDHLRKRFLLRTLEDYTMPVYELKPTAVAERHPIVVAFHGHGRGKDEVAGVALDSEGRDRIARLNYAYGLGAVRRGYRTFVPDMRGFGERSLGKDSCRRVNGSAIAAGVSLKGLHTWDAMRLLDLIETRESRPIGVIGLSGGGGSALWLSALDDRVRFSVISAFLKNYSEATVGCSCNLVPGQLALADRGDLAALIVPRALYVQYGKEDPSAPDALVRQAFETAARAAATVGGEAPILEKHRGGHAWSDAGVWDWMNGLEGK